MSERVPVTGQCLCGAVSVRARVLPSFDACHCKMCRTWGGGPMLAIHAGSDATFTGHDMISSYTSSDWAERAFCRRCGTHLYYRLRHDGEYVLPLGLLADDLKARFREQIFIDRKPASYRFADETSDLTEQEFFAKRAPPPD